jgi:chromosome partitioning protein
VKTGSKVELLPADISLAGGETELLSKVGSFGLLKEQLEEVAGEYDHILLDCPPSLGLLTINALVSADSVLIPVQCQFFALKGLAALLETIQSVRRRLNSSLKILGVLPTMAEMNTVLCKDVLAALKERLVGERLFLPVPKSVKFSESTMAGLPIHLYAQEEKLLAGYQEIVGVILSEGGKP